MRVCVLLVLMCAACREPAKKVEVPPLPKKPAWVRTNACDLTDGYIGTPELTLDKLAKCEVYAVHVTATQTGQATRGDPPRVQVSVDEALRGPAEKGDRMFAVIGTDDSCDAPGHCPANAEERPVPNIGDDLVIAGGWSADRSWFDVAYGGFFPASKADPMRAFARQLAAEGK
jgi:hypothetical protein